MGIQKEDLSDFDSDVVAVARWVFKKLLIYWNFHTQPTMGLTENGLKKRKEKTVVADREYFLGTIWASLALC